MDSVLLATVTAALTALGLECVKGVGSGAGKDLWAKARALLGWKADPAPEQLPREIAQRLAQDPQLLDQVMALLQSRPAEMAAQMVGSIIASGERAFVAQTVNSSTVILGDQYGTERPAGQKAPKE